MSAETPASIKPQKLRLDQALVARSLADSREQAQRFILAGSVWLNGHMCDKASKVVLPDAQIEVRLGEKYVSRGGFKLEGALTHFAIDVTAARCLDLGSSTGGFTDCLLQHGAAHVTAIDVGQNQMHWKLRQDPRITLHEGVNARYLASQTAELLQPPAHPPYDIIVADLSFISLRLVLPVAFPMLALPNGRLIALIKPQFEAGRAEIGKGGIVRDPAVRERVVADLHTWLHAYPVQTLGTMESPLPGRDGNIEYLWLIGPGK